MKQPAALPALSIVVPTLNEAENIEQLCKRITDSFKGSGVDYEILFVDDCSTDDTVLKAEVAARNFPPQLIRLETKKGQRGKAFSLLQGFSAARYDIVCMIDADLQYPPEAILSMYKMLIKNNADVVLTERFDHETSFMRQLSSKMFNLIFTKLMFGIDYDTQSGLKLFRKSVIENMNLTPSPWSFDLEFIIRALEGDYKILNKRISFAARVAGKPKVHIISVAYELAVASIKLRRSSATKQVRMNYQQNLQLLRRSAIVITGLVIGIASVVGISSQSAEALSLPGSPLKSLTSSATQALNSTASGALSSVQSVLGLPASQTIPTSSNSTNTPSTPSANDSNPSNQADNSQSTTTSSFSISPSNAASSKLSSTNSSTTGAGTGSSSMVSSKADTAAVSSAPLARLGATAKNNNSSATIGIKSAVSKTQSARTGSTNSKTSQTKARKNYYKEYQLSSTLTRNLELLASRLAVLGVIFISTGAVVLTLWASIKRIKDRRHLKSARLFQN